MAAELKKKTRSRLDLTSKQMRERFKNYRNKYQSTYLLYQSSGFGLTEDDKMKGIQIVMDKLNHLCPYYDLMDQLFGKKANITPWHSLMPNVPTWSTIQMMTMPVQTEIHRLNMLLNGYHPMKRRSLIKLITSWMLLTIFQIPTLLKLFIHGSFQVMPRAYR